MAPKSNDWGLYGEEDLETRDTRRGDDHMKMEAESAQMQQVKGCQRLPATTRRYEGTREDSS